jgi:hypothetical protein
MTDDDIKTYLKDKGCPKIVWEGGTERLLQRWNDFVAEVEKGYCPECLIDDYWNDLELRELIHEIGCDDLVQAADHRFRSMLTAVHIKHYYKERNTDYDFWNYGYPKNATGFFYEQIKCHILGQS